MKYNKIICPVLIVFFAIIGCSSEKNEISQWRGPDRDGIYSEKDILKKWPENGPELLWKYEELGIGFSSAAITSNRVFTAGTIDSITYLFSFDLDGKLLWKKETGPGWMGKFPGAHGTPLIYNNLGYFLNSEGKLLCFHPENGETEWSKNLFIDFDARKNLYGITENLLINDDVLFCIPGGEESNVIALNRLTGKLIWKSKGCGEISSYGSPIIIDDFDKTFLVAMTKNSVFSLDASNGELAWNYTLGTDTMIWISHPNIPIYDDGYLFVKSDLKIGSVMLKITDNGYKATEIWKNEKLMNCIGDAVLLDNKLYSAGGRSLFALDWKTGKVLFEDKKYKLGSIISVNGQLYCYGHNGKLALVNPTENSFDMISSFYVGNEKKGHWSQPVIKNGRLYIRHNNSLFVYSVRK